MCQLYCIQTRIGLKYSVGIVKNTFTIKQNVYKKEIQNSILM